MIKSMTAYGRSCISSSLGRFVVEIQSVNRKHLDVSVLLPKELARFDAEIKQWIAAEVFRGQVTVKIFVSFEKSSPVVVTPNLPLVRQMKSAWDQIIRELGLDPSTAFSLDLLPQEEILLFDETLQNEEEYRENLRKCMQEALIPFQDMRKREGVALQEDILKRLVIIDTALKKIKLKAPEATGKYRKKLQERLEEVLAGSIENEERILREVTLYAERIDITEELVRFDSHIAQAYLLLENGTESVGKTFEFILQEMNREINTISSKSSEIEVSKGVIEIKSEIERMREQIQNIE
jgi:uncharacterized protein (TIGR00255 family)